MRGARNPILVAVCEVLAEGAECVREVRAASSRVLVHQAEARIVQRGAVAFVVRGTSGAVRAAANVLPIATAQGCRTGAAAKAVVRNRQTFLSNKFWTDFMQRLVISSRFNTQHC